MLIADIRHHLDNQFFQIHWEFLALCGSNLQAAGLLGDLFWWSQVADKEPERQGWLYKSAVDLNNELNLTRRGYEKARKCLLELGVIEYRRAGAHGKMHWRLNRKVLLQKICDLKNIAFPSEIRHQIDADGFHLDSWVPPDLWNAYLKMRQEKDGKLLGPAQKKRLLKKLKELHHQKRDLRPIMERAIISGWNSFFPLENHPPQTANLISAKVEAEAMTAQLKQQMADREEKPPDKDRNPDNPGRKAILDKVKHKKQ
ncbi:MAG: hypothetical protein Q4A84_08365 [Neisseria sp.]|uniref:hypothetical protein n=1 Tax=Neisseria sp. TaxID=192066 RepID=UPI0026DC7EC6|nr:hypothetical protein [Neisseria sp.]MDO4641692.1 hypothetical protein [Neisseria sp.]